MYQHKEVSVTVETPLMSDIIETTLRNRVNRVAEDVMRQMSVGLYGDREPFKPLTMREKISRNIHRLGGRIRDSWLVLTGQAYIDNGDY